MSNPEPSQFDDAGYLETFSLRCEPFADGIDNHFFYAGETLLQKLDLLAHLTQFGDAVVLVTGAPGSGKTTLLSRYVSQCNKHWQLCLMDAAEGFSQFASRLADVLASDTLSNEETLINHWASQTDSRQLLVIVIDNADQLNEHALARLSALFDHSWASRIRIIMFSVPESQQRLKNVFESSDPAIPVQQIVMPRLSEEETSSYLMYRLAVAGYSGKSPFTPTEIGAMCKAAVGRPSDINGLARQALLERHARKTSKRIPTSVGRPRNHALAWGLVSITMVASATFLARQYLYSTTADGDWTSTQGRQMKEIALNLPEPKRTPEPHFSAIKRIAKSAPDALDASLQVAGKMVKPAPQPKQAGAPSSPLPLAQPATSHPPALLHTVAELAVLNLDRPPPEAQAADARALSTEAVAQDAAPAGTAEQAIAAVDEEAKKPPPYREPWLLQQQEDFFSLQLLGSRNEKSIASYVRRHQLDEQQVAYYRGVYRGEPWFVLMYGIYPSKQAALEGRAALSAQVRDAKPWPRTFKSVHRSIRAAQ